MSMNEEILIPLAGIALPIVLVPTIMGMRQASRKREMQHAERMRALELGQPITGQSHWAAAVAAIGAGVPLTSFIFTFLAYVNSHNPPGEIWMAPTITSFFALVGAVKLGALAFKPPKPQVADEPAYNGKPHYDPDAYETVGR